MPIWVMLCFGFVQSFTIKSQFTLAGLLSEDRIGENHNRTNYGAAFPIEENDLANASRR